MIDSDTTLGQLAAQFTDLVIEHAAEKHVKHATLNNNILNAEVFNMMHGGTVIIVYKAKINEEEFEARDTIIPGIKEEDVMVFNIGKGEENLYISQRVLKEVHNKISNELVKRIKNISK